MSVKSFDEDRRAMLLRTVPILIVGTSFVLVVAFNVFDTGQPLSGFRPRVWLMTLGFSVVATLLRFDVWLLVLRRPVRYEIEDSEFRAYRGEQLVTRVSLLGLERWSAPDSFNRKWLYFGFVYSQNFGMPYEEGPIFYLYRKGAVADEVTAPFMFRWKHLGGADDVTAALKEAIGWGPGWRN